MHEFLDETLESLPDIVHTKDGAAIVRELLARGVARVSELRWLERPLGDDADFMMTMIIIAGPTKYPSTVQETHAESVRGRRSADRHFHGL